MSNTAFVFTMLGLVLLSCAVQETFKLRDGVKEKDSSPDIDCCSGGGCACH